MKNKIKLFLEKPISSILLYPLILWIIGCFIFEFFNANDPDLWWHLNVGRDILSKGIQYGDIYSYTLPGYLWVDHEWLLNIIMYIFYTLSGNNFILLSVFFISLTFFSFYNIIHSALKNPNSNTGKLVLCISLFMALASTACCLGIRAQIISLFFASFIWSIVNNNKLKLYKYFPILFLLWANLHGAVIIGLALLMFDLLLSFKKKRIFKYKIFVWFLCFLFTFINPYTFHLYIEAFQAFTNSNVKQFIQEWQSLNIRDLRFFPITFYIFTLYALLIYAFVKKIKIKPLYLITILIFTVLAFRNIRHITLFVLLSLPVYTIVLEELINKIKFFSIKIIDFCSMRYGVSLFAFIFIFLCTNNFAFDRASNDWKALIKEDLYYKEYPKKPLDFIEKNKLTENILADFRWGGFISWYKPNIKVFIDGRMPHWKNLIQDFDLMYGKYEGKYDQNLLQKYKIKYLLISDKHYEKCKTKLLQNWQVIYKDKQYIILKN